MLAGNGAAPDAHRGVSSATTSPLPADFLQYLSLERGLSAGQALSLLSAVVSARLQLRRTKPRDRKGPVQFD